MVINPIVGIYIPIIRIPIKGGMTIPNIAIFDHGTCEDMILFKPSRPLVFALLGGVFPVISMKNAPDFIAVQGETLQFVHLGG